MQKAQTNTDRRGQVEKTALARSILRAFSERVHDTAPVSRLQSPSAALSASIRVSTRSSDSIPVDARRHWTINGDFLTLKSTGIARFGREVTKQLDALIGARHPLAQGLTLDLVTPVRPREQLNLDHVRICGLPELRPRLPQVWVQAQLPRHLPGGLLSFCNLAPIRADRHIVCIHDLQTRMMPESYSLAFRLAHRLILPHLARRAEIVTTVSAYSKATFVGFGLCPSHKVVVVPNGCDHALTWRSERASTSWRRDRPFVLCIGRDEAHKNTGLVWHIAPALDVLGVDVVVVGDFDPARLDAKFGGRPTNVRCFARVSDDELARGFAEALCFLFPSKTEGFGLPALEAMVCGCPVLASLSPAVMEACGSAALYADPDDMGAWVQAVEHLVTEADLASKLRSAGRAQAARFKWQDVAKTYLRLMAMVDENHARPRRSIGQPLMPLDGDALLTRYR